MKLSVMERLSAIRIIAQEGNILFLRMRQDLISKIGINDKDIKHYSFVFKEEGSAKCNPDIPQEAEFDLTDSEKGMIEDALRDLNRQSQLTLNDMTLYEKFIEGEQSPSLGGLSGKKNRN